MRERGGGRRRGGGGGEDREGGGRRRGGREREEVEGGGEERGGRRVVGLSSVNIYFLIPDYSISDFSNFACYSFQLSRLLLLKINIILNFKKNYFFKNL